MVTRSPTFPSTSRCLSAAALAVLALAALLPAAAVAQSYHIRTYTEQDGLPCYAVHGVTQDGQGRMWFATYEGMVCYDGQSWDTTDQGSGFPRPGYRDTIASASGGIWAADGRQPIALSFFDGDTWTRIPRPTVHTEDWWVIGAMAAFSDDEGRDCVTVAAAQGVVGTWDGTDWSIRGPDDRLRDLTGMAVHRGRTYLATPRGLHSFDHAAGEVELHLLDGQPVHDVVGVAESRDGETLWIVGESWIGRLRDDRLERVYEGPSFDMSMLHFGVSILEDPMGGLYFGDAASVYYYRDGSVETLTRESGLSSDGVNDFFLDREGNIWIASQRGVSKIISRRFAGLTHRQGLFEDEVSAIHELPSGQMLLGHPLGLTFWGEEPEVLDLGRNPGAASRVMDIEEDPKGVLWLACNQAGLARLHAEQQIAWYREAEGLAGYAYAIHFDRAGQMWAGTNEGLFRRTAEGFDRVRMPGFEPGHYASVRRVGGGPDGSIYVATGKTGVFRLLGDEITQYTDRARLGGNSAYCVEAFPGGPIWVGTGSGLFEIVGDGLVKTSPPDPVIDRPTYSILKDDRERIWFGTDAGVKRWDGARLQHFTVEDGLHGRETNRDALVLASDGAVWVGTDSGVWIYRDEFDLPSLAAPLLEILGYEVDGRRYSADERLVLHAPAKQITFRFRGLTFIDEERTRYRTWLEGFQPDFEAARELPSQEIRYTNVPAGEYRFHVQALGVDGRESTVASTGTITVLSEIWFRWWALASYALLLLGGSWVGITLHTRRRYAQELEKEVHARTLKLQESERAVKVESRKLEVTLLSISDGVLTLNPDLEIVLANPAAESVLGLGSAELAGRTLRSVLEGVLEIEGDPPAGSGITVIGSAESMQEAIECGAHRVFRLTPPDRPPRYLEISGAAMRTPDDEQVGTVLALRDVTAQRLLDSELARRQKLESLGLLAGGIAHDFNNLLTVIQGNLNLATTSSEKPDEHERHFEKALRATENASRLTQQLLTFAKGGAPKLQVVSVAEIVEQSVDLTMSGARADCRIEKDADLRNIIADPTQLRQAIGNILINSRQSMGDAGTIRVSCCNHRQGEREEVVVSIQDEGCGIPARDLPRIYDPYFTTREKGSGLGLAIVHSIVERHRGRLVVATEPGRGTEFSIYLPATEQQPATRPPSSDLDEPRGGRVLILDDEADIREILSRMLAQLGFDCVTVADGRDAVDAYDRARSAGTPFTFAILDLTVAGGMGGLETLDQLRQIDPEVRAIVTSGYADNTALAEYQRHGFVACLEKPYTMGQLRTVMANASSQAVTPRD